jgi:hypothetical protein
MIHCPNCKIEFSPSYESCPRCGEFPTPREERLVFYRRKAEEYAERRAARDDVRSYLIENGFNDLEADDAVNEAFRSVAGENRSHGRLRAIIGISTLFLGVSLLCIIALFVLCVHSPIQRAGASIVKLGIIGAALTIFGLLALISGLWSSTTGK